MTGQGETMCDLAYRQSLSARCILECACKVMFCGYSLALVAKVLENLACAANLDYPIATRVVYTTSL
jgi:hypothetical protein